MLWKSAICSRIVHKALDLEQTKDANIRKERHMWNMQVSYKIQSRKQVCASIMQRYKKINGRRKSSCRYKTNPHFPDFLLYYNSDRIGSNWIARSGKWTKDGILYIQNFAFHFSLHDSDAYDSFYLLLHDRKKKLYLLNYRTSTIEKTKKREHNSNLLMISLSYFSSV